MPGKGEGTICGGDSPAPPEAFLTYQLHSGNWSLISYEKKKKTLILLRIGSQILLQMAAANGVDGAEGHACPRQKNNNNEGSVFVS